MPSRQLDEEAIFHVARGISDPVLRTTYLDQVCVGDQPLRERVEALIKVHEREQEFLKSAPQPAVTTDRPVLAEEPGKSIGRYKLLQQIGEGGFGVVYMAEQERPIRRKVALKVIKPGMDTHAVVARFEAERQALALMDHPNIARVLDGGATDSGRPYFVMELVKGVPLTEYCDQNQLPAEERLKLFITVCQAVQHAHQKGIIHRDLKPSNILVTLHDGQPVVKVIDFGVAKAINQQLTEKTLFTTFGQMVGTPAYMSPEQAEMSGLDVDTRSDIYSLGVLLYELLTGTTPLESDRLRTAGYAEIQRLIREEEPPKPSTRLSTSGEKLTAIAKLRRTTPDRLRNAIRNDLDWVAIKCLEKDRSRRYETAAALATEIERFLADQPIMARAPSAGYRLRKFARRNVLAVSAGFLIMLSVAVGIVGVLWNASQVNNLAERLGETLRSLQDELLDRALADALAGDIKATDASLERASLAGAPSTMILPLQGIAHLNGGNLKRSIELLEEAKLKEPENEAIYAALSEAYLNAGRYWEIASLHETVARLESDKGSRGDDLARVLVARMQVSGIPHYPPFIEELNGIVSRHPRWGIVYAVRSEARREMAKRTKKPGDLSLARADADTAVGYYPNNPYVLASSLAAYITSIELARLLKGESAQQIAGWEQRAQLLADRMEAYEDYTWGRLKRLEYFRLMGQQREVLQEQERLLALSIGGRQRKAAQLLAARDREGLNALTGEAGLDLGPSIAGKLLSIIEGDPDAGMRELRSQGHRLWRGQGP